MKTPLVIYINMSKGKFLPYSIPEIDAIKAAYPNVTSFDFDLDSEKEVRDLAVKALKNSETILVILYAEQAVPLSDLGLFLHHLKKYPEKRIMVVISEIITGKDLLNSFKNIQLYISKDRKEGLAKSIDFLSKG